MTNKSTSNLMNAVSPYDDFCEGFGNVGTSGGSYILGLTLGVGVVEKQFSHYGSSILDEIISFDLAEIEDTYIGQLNMSTVSSFCGPQGLIWGYDIVQHDEINKPESTKTFNYKGKEIHVKDARYLIESTRSLFGSLNEKRFYLKPGSHVPFAGKNKKIAKEATIYAGIAIGIPKDRKRNACLLMEDIGVLNSSWFNTKEETVTTNLISSVMQIGMNQNIEYEECFVGIKSCEVPKDQMGCALVAAPYFALAKNALLKKPDGTYDYEAMFSTSLSEWERKVIK